MLADVKLDETDRELMKRIAHFAQARTETGVYVGQFYSESLSTEVLVIVGLGEQAQALLKILTETAEKQKEHASGLIIAPGVGGNGF